MTITDPTRTSTDPIKGWCEDPQAVRQQLTHAVEPGHLVALCGVRVIYTGDSWVEFTRLGRCAVCRNAARGLDPQALPDRRPPSLRVM